MGQGLEMAGEAEMEKGERTDVDAGRSHGRMSEPGERVGRTDGRMEMRKRQLWRAHG